LRIILLLVPLIMIGAMGQMLVIVARHVDLSIGSTQAFAAMVTALMFKFYPEVPWGLGFVVAIGIGAALGLFNGALITLFPPAGHHRDPGHAQSLSRAHLHRFGRQAGGPAICAIGA
jgi:hypothetical protein